MSEQDRCTCIQQDHQHKPHGCRNKGQYRGAVCLACRTGHGEQDDEKD